MPELPPSGSATTKPNGSVATPPPIEAAPAATAPGQPGAPAGIDPPIQLERSSAASKPANAGLAAAGLPSEPASADVSVAARASDVRRDSQIILASAEKSKVPSKTRPHSPKNAGLPAARVGDEVITFRDLNSAVAELKSRYGIPQINGFDSVQEMQLRQFEARLRNEALNTLIDQSLLVQEAKHHLKDKKMLEKAYDAADGIFHDNEVVPLERKYNVDNERQLKEKLAEEGKSLDAMRTAFRRYFLAHNYLHEKIKDRLNVELPDLLKYYNDHVYEHEFDRPAQITWREIVVEADQHKTREEAQKKALALLEKLGHGADFAALAKNESEGPTSSRNKGGLMETAPGSYVVKQINDALDKLPLGQHSGIIEGPNSFHIIKVEKRRPAGPASFEEVQDKIKPKLVDQKRQEESTAFLAKITRDALIVKFTGENAPLADAH
jgi:peptidyl-prolyl cis-trans isomerase SurA